MIGSPPIYKPCSWPFGRGPTTRSLGDLRSPWLLIKDLRLHTHFSSCLESFVLLGIGKWHLSAKNLPKHGIFKKPKVMIWWCWWWRWAVLRGKGYANILTFQGFKAPHSFFQLLRKLRVAGNWQMAFVSQKFARLSHHDLFG